MVFATAVRLLGNAADAEDAAQTVFLKAFERFEELGSSPAAAGWMKTTTRNVCLNHLSRYRSRWRLFSEMDRGDGGDSAFADTLESSTLPVPAICPRPKPPAGSSRCRRSATAARAAEDGSP